MPTKLKHCNMNRKTAAVAKGQSVKIPAVTRVHRINLLRANEADEEMTDRHKLVRNKSASITPQRRHEVKVEE